MSITTDELIVAARKMYGPVGLDLADRLEESERECTRLAAELFQAKAAAYRLHQAWGRFRHSIDDTEASFQEEEGYKRLPQSILGGQQHQGGSHDG